MTYANGLFPGSGLGQAKKGWQGKSVKLPSTLITKCKNDSDTI